MRDLFYADMASPRVVTVALLLLLLGVNSDALMNGKFVIQPHPVQFNEDPHNWTVTIGASVSLTCNTTVVQVIGYINENITPLPQIRWFRNNVMINSTSNDHFTINSYGIDTSILTITNVTLLEQGEYHCVVNEWVKPNGDWWTKTRSRSGYITVIDNSSIVTVNSEENIILSCVESTVIDAVWLKDGVEMSEQTTDYNGILVLQLNDVVEDNRGHYECVNSKDKSDILFSCHLTVKANSRYSRMPLQLHSKKGNHYITVRSDADINGCRGSPENQSVTLHCSTRSVAIIQWYKNGEVLDVDSEGTTFNQTTGDLIIRREDPCELLGVYQCFASNEIDTVQVSTRVLPFGWPNRPGRPELLNSEVRMNGFDLTIKLYHPDHLGGLQIKELEYDVYHSTPAQKPQFIETVYTSNASKAFVIKQSLMSKIRIYDLTSLRSVYLIHVQLAVKNKSMAEIVSLPEGSPVLEIQPACDLVDYPLPTVNNYTCDYINSNGLYVMFNMSWYAEGGVLNYNFNEKVWWIVGAECYYPNGTEQLHFSGLYASSTRLNLTVNSTCNFTITYYTICGTIYGIFTQLTQICGDIGRPTPPAVSDATFAEDVVLTENTESSTPNVIVITGVPTAGIVMIAVLIIICYWRSSHREPSAAEMLYSVKVLNKIKMAGPVSVGAQSEVGLNASCSDIYLEKVTGAEKVAKWLEDEQDNNTSFHISNPGLDDISLKSTEMYDFIVQGQAGISPFTQCRGSRHEPVKDVSLSPASLVSRDSCAFLLSELTGARLHQAAESRTTKTRQLSTDSGVESNYPTSIKCNHFVNPFKRSQQAVEVELNHSSLTGVLNDLHNEVTDDTSVYSGLYQSTMNTSSGLPEMCNSSSQLDSDVFKSSTEQSGNYIKPETLNKMEATFDTRTVQHVSTYVRPDTLEWDDKPYHCHSEFDASVSADSGLVDKAVHSGELSTGSHNTGSHDTEQDLQFNNDGYVTSPV